MNKKIYHVAQPYFSNSDINWIQKKVFDILTGKLSTGPLTALFEKKFAKFIGTKYAVFLNSCTSALEIAVKSLKLTKNDEVIVPAQTFIATGIAVTLQGAKVVFAEINPDTFCINLAEIKKRITKNTKAIMLVYFAGYIPEDIIQIKNFCKKNKIIIIEDCAHAIGSRIKNKKVGSIGIAGCFSFFSTKTITTAEGGMLTTNDKKLYDYAISLRERGRDWTKPVEIYKEAWRNCRVPEFNALLGLKQFSNINKIINHRGQIALIYDNYISKSLHISTLPKYKGIKLSLWKHITIINNNKINRNKLAKNLFNKYGIVINWAYTPPIHLQPVYKKLYNIKSNSLPITENIMKKHFHLPLHMKIRKKDAIIK